VSDLLPAITTASAAPSGIGSSRETGVGWKPVRHLGPAIGPAQKVPNDALLNLACFRPVAIGNGSAAELRQDSMQHILASKQGQECIIGNPCAGHIGFGLDTNSFNNRRARFQGFRHGEGQHVQDFVIT